MRNIILICLLSLLVSGCGNEESLTFDTSAVEYKKRIMEALEKDEGSFLDFYEKEDTDYGYSIKISNYMLISIFQDEKEEVEGIRLLSVGDALRLQSKELQRAFFILLSVADEELSVAQKYLVLEELGVDTVSNSLLDHTSSYTLNDITYSFKGNPDKNSLYLQATPK